MPVSQLFLSAVLNRAGEDTLIRRQADSVRIRHAVVHEQVAIARQSGVEIRKYRRVLVLRRRDFLPAHTVQHDQDNVRYGFRRR